MTEQKSGLRDLEPVEDPKGGADTKSVSEPGGQVPSVGKTDPSDTGIWGTGGAGIWGTGGAGLDKG